MFDENFYYRLTGRLRSTAIFDRFDGLDSSVEAPSIFQFNSLIRSKITQTARHDGKQKFQLKRYSYNRRGLI